ncbi:MAG: GLPGLI family protein [Bacteroidetes bacterium]|nr:GLPGLI family protein [Bacteroidota bacterium]
MKTKYFFLFLGLLLWNISFSQDNIQISVQYKLQFKTDSLATDYETENFILLANKEKGHFQSTVTYVKDSLLANPKNDISNIMETYNTDNGYYIEMTPSKNTVIHYQPTNSSKIFYENNSKINWKIQNEYKTLLGFKCKKATTSHLGRNWEAWFTEEYPFALGPYKFYGLPGLILQLNDTKNDYNFEAFRIKKYKNKVYTFNSQPYLKVDKNKFWEIYNQDKYRLNPLFDGLSFENEKVIPTMQRNLQLQQKKENNPLERKH